MATKRENAIKLSGDIWQRWEAKHEELTSSGRWNLSGLFYGHEPPTFREAAKRVLYTGKATAGPYNDPENNWYNCNTRSFWSFAKKLSYLTGGNANALENVAWTNLCKIGVCKGNPGKKLVEAQIELAVETLRQEWIEFNRLHC